ncbi:MAG: DJ-1/PfpI family protein [bacterium]
MSNMILMVIAPNLFRDEEYLEPRNVFTAAGFSVVTAASRLGTAKGKLGATVNVDHLLKNVKLENYNAVIFVGGPGSYDYFTDKTALDLAREAIKQEKVLGGICAGAAILAKAGVLKGKQATCFSGVADILKAEGAYYTGKNVEQDGKIITADGPQSARKFGETIVKLLK